MFLTITIAAIVLVTYLWHANRAISTTPPEALKLCQKPWTDAELKTAYEKAQTSPTDVKLYLYPKKNRRYIVAGGSGFVGGWIVQHLLMRGEDPAAIRILDVVPPRREDTTRYNVDFVKTDVTDPEAVSKSFQKAWPGHVKDLPLTVFHTIAIISPSDRYSDFLSPYVKVNILGTKNVVKVSKAAGATCLVATSSASVGLKPPAYFPWPWQTHPSSIYQFLPNAEPSNINGKLYDFGSCYAWSKAQAEQLVREANDPQNNFVTGVIRPGHAIYGHGLDASSSITWDYLRRGGSPSWIPNVAANFVNAQNVSVGHLAYENALLQKTNPGGKAYCVTDPNPPILYGQLYRFLEKFADPRTPIRFPYVPHMVMYLIGHCIEKYQLLRVRYLKFLPPVTGDIVFLTPAVFNMCTLHVIYTDTAAQDEIGYKAPIQTREGFALALVDWNKKVEEDAKSKKRNAGKAEVDIQDPSAVPKAPPVH